MKMTKSELKEMIREALREELGRMSLTETMEETRGNLIALVSSHSGGMYSVWTGFNLSADEQAAINAILEPHINEGGSTLGSASEVLEDLASCM
jgi:hypothetical protein